MIPIPMLISTLEQVKKKNIYKLAVYVVLQEKPRRTEQACHCGHFNSLIVSTELYFSIIITLTSIHAEIERERGQNRRVLVLC